MYLKGTGRVEWVKLSHFDDFFFIISLNDEKTIHTVLVTKHYSVNVGLLLISMNFWYRVYNNFSQVQPFHPQVGKKAPESALLAKLIQTAANKVNNQDR